MKLASMDTALPTFQMSVFYVIKDAKFALTKQTTAQPVHLLEHGLRF